MSPHDDDRLLTICDLHVSIAISIGYLSGRLPKQGNDVWL